MCKGIIKHFNKEKGYGFISREGEKDIYFHISNCIGSDFRKLDKVTYNITENRRGDMAIDVTLVEDEED